MSEKEPVKLNQNIAGEIAELRDELHQTTRSVKTIASCMQIITFLIVFPIIIVILYALGAGSR